MSSTKLQSSFVYETERLRFRGLTHSDIEGPYLHWFNDQEVCRYNSHGAFPSTREKMQAYIKMLQTSENNLVWAVIEKSREVHIGNISLQSIDRVNRSAELAIIMGDKSCWGKGYALEAAKIIIDHGFRRLGLHRIYCGTSENNLGMIKLAGRLCMKREGVRCEALFENGGFVNAVEFGLLKGDSNPGNS